MEVSTTLNKNIDLADKMSAYDEHAKNLLAIKSVTARILKYTLREFKDYEPDFIEQKKNDFSFIFLYLVILSTSCNNTGNIITITTSTCTNSTSKCFIRVISSLILSGFINV